MLRGRITAINGVPADKVKHKGGEGWILEGDRGITWSTSVPEGSRIVAGQWWPADYRGPPLISLDREVFDAFGLKFGDTITVNVLGREITGAIANSREFNWSSLAINFVMKGRDQVTVEWDDSKAEKRGSAELVAQYNELAKKPGTATARNEGDIDQGFATAAKVLEASFEFPYLAHAALEPLNAVARLNADGTLEVWGGHQMPDLYQAMAAQTAGITPDKVTLHVLKTGGGFGRRATPDSDVIIEAVTVAKALGGRAPVKVQWTREDDMRGGRYRPLYVHALKAGLDAQGNLVAWRNHIVGQSILAGTPFGALVQHGIDLTSVEGAANIPYAIPNLRVELTTTDVGVPVLWWRSVGSTHTAYAVEAFLDEVAEAAGKDPVEFRLALLKDHPRHDRIADMLVHAAAVLDDDRIGAGIESLDQPPQVLGIELGRERREAAEIGEENRHLPALTGSLARCCGGRRGANAWGRCGRATSAAAAEAFARRIGEAAGRTVPSQFSAAFGAKFPSRAIVQIASRTAHRSTFRSCHSMLRATRRSGKPSWRCARSGCNPLRGTQRIRTDGVSGRADRRQPGPGAPVPRMPARGRLWPVVLVCQRAAVGSNSGRHRRAKFPTESTASSAASMVQRTPC